MATFLQIGLALLCSIAGLRGLLPLPEIAKYGPRAIRRPGFRRLAGAVGIVGAVMLLIC